MKTRREFALGTTAFIDVMACGLGAVLLLFVLVEFNAGEEPVVPSAAEVQVPNPPNGTKDDLDIIQSEINDLVDLVATLEVSLLERQIRRSDLTQRVSDAQKARENSRQTPPQPEPTNTPSGQLIGLTVSDRSIVILLDISASMYSESIEEALYYSLAPSQLLAQKSAKWLQAKRIASWIIEAAPETAVINIALFNDKVKPLWLRAKKKSEAKLDVSKLLSPFFPDGPTNLQEGLKWATSGARASASIYIITDGLPTAPKPGNVVTRNLTDCRADPKGFVSGPCRLKILADSASRVSLRSPVNVILLPLEGDPLAAPAYWELSKSTGGTVFIPDRSWP